VPKLSKADRDALPADSFAIPAKRLIPLHDARHVSMAWEAVSAAANLTPEERRLARVRVVERAAELGLDATGWKLPLHMTLSAMALNISNSDHPNKMPFSGVLTRINEPSDKPPEGSGGRLITISSEAAEKNLGSLLGMAVDYKPNLDGHDPKAKIGVITAATIEGNAILIEGFVYAADFPDVAAEIKANKDALGFSYECRNLFCNDPDANPIVITDCIFTGAAILRKDKAAYHSTSLSAQAEKDSDMTPEQEKQLADLAAGVAALTASLQTISASVEDIKKAGPATVNANANTMALVEPHAKACEACASGMEAAGIGGHPERGHAVMLRKMAGNMRAAAAMGQIPHIYRDHDYFMNAAADTGNANATKPLDGAELAAKVEAAVKPLADKLAAVGTQLADLKAKAFADSPAPERKTVKPEITALLAKAGLEAPADGSKLALGKVDAALKELPVSQRLTVKAALSQAGLID
jgi:hypothetical protein